MENDPDNGAPIVFETNPTYNNLFGRIENVMQMGGVATTNFTLIKPGALHRANGGYLIVDAREVLINPFAWESLKRCIRNSEIKIEDVLEQYRFMTVVSLKPEPIPLHAKIIMIGSLHDLLPPFLSGAGLPQVLQGEGRFRLQDQPHPEIMQDYALFVASHCKKEGLLPFDASGVAALLEHAARLVEDQERLSTQFMELSDLIREASYWASSDGAQLVDRRLGQKGDRGEDLPQQPDRGADPGIPGRRHHPVRHRGERGRADERPLRHDPRRLHLRQAFAPHHPRHPGAGRHGEHRAGGEALRADPRQGGADPDRLPRREVRAGQAALLLRLHLLRAVLRGGRRGQRLLDGALRPAFRALRDFRSARGSPSPAASTSTARCSRSAG